MILRSRRVYSAALLTFLAASSAQLLAQSSSRYAAIEQMVSEARAAAGAPAMSIAVVENDRLAWSTGVGMADVEQGVSATGHTVYRIASISKPIAATAVMQLVERGRVRLDDPIQKYVPAFPQKGEVTVTLRHLLTHTSGIRHYNPGEMENHEAFQSIEAAIGIFKDDPLLFSPGTRYSYSSYAFNLLAGVVEQASGIRYEAYLQEHIFTPAGMTATRLEHPQDIVQGRARQYVRGGGRGQVRNAPYADLSIKWAGGGVISTAEDLCRFHIALDEGRLLRPETLREMYQPFTLADGTKSDYALGWMISTDAKGRSFVSHSGGATGGTTHLLRYPEGRLAVAVLCNLESVAGLRELAERIAHALLDTPTTSAGRPDRP